MYAGSQVFTKARGKTGICKVNFTLNEVQNQSHGDNFIRRFD